MALNQYRGTSGSVAAWPPEGWLVAGGIAAAACVAAAAVADPELWLFAAVACVVAGAAFSPTDDDAPAPGVVRSFTPEGELRWETEAGGLGDPPQTTLKAVSIDSDCRPVVAGRDQLSDVEARLFLAVLEP